MRQQIHFIPAFFVDPARYPAISALDGVFNVLLIFCVRHSVRAHVRQWNGGWPLHLTPTHPRREIELPTLDTDTYHLHNLGGRTFMAAVSPWFFTVRNPLVH
jgi:glucan endo-1,3-alpha-glucosidase